LVEGPLHLRSAKGPCLLVSSDGGLPLYDGHAYDGKNGEDRRSNHDFHDRKTAL
jgi:hypothetical protein